MSCWTEADMTIDLPLPGRYLSKNIVIIGAGVAGLSCAKELWEKGFDHITVLEATGDIGGRARTLVVDGHYEKYFVEFGPDSIHRSQNFFYGNAVSANQVDENAPDYRCALNNLKTVYSPDEKKIIKELVNFYSKLVYLPCHPGEIINSEEFRKQFEGYEEEILKFYAEGVYNWHRRLVYIYRFSPVKLKKGFHTLFCSFLQGFPTDHIEGMKEVYSINWSCLASAEKARSKKNPRIHIKCWEDAGYYVADHVVIAIPIGYLKKNIETLVIPKLPEDKINAVRSVNLITVDKIYLVFDEPFWEELDIFHVIWNSELDEFFDEPVSENPKSWLQYITHFEYVHNFPNILSAWIWDEGAEIMEKLSIMIVSDSCRRLLECLLSKRLPIPSNCYRSIWKHNHLHCGAVPYDLNRDQREHMSKIAETVYGGVSGTQPVILFAGDATNVTDSACVHGAADTGVRAANEIYAYYDGLRNAENP